MGTVLKVSEAATSALHTMVMFAARPSGVLSTREIASVLNASEAHLAKVLQRLTRAGLVRATRGPKGGFALNKRGDQVALLDVYEAIEGSLEDGCCLLGTPVCTKGKCIFGDLLGSLNESVRNRLAKTKLTDAIGAYGVKKK